MLAPMKPLRLMLDAAVANAFLEACTHDENAHVELRSSQGPSGIWKSDRLSKVIHACRWGPHQQA